MGPTMKSERKRSENDNVERGRANGTVSDDRGGPFLRRTNSSENGDGGGGVVPSIDLDAAAPAILPSVFIFDPRIQHWPVARKPATFPPFFFLCYFFGGNQTLACPSNPIKILCIFPPKMLFTFKCHPYFYVSPPLSVPFVMQIFETFTFLLHLLCPFLKSTQPKPGQTMASFTKSVLFKLLCFVFALKKGIFFSRTRLLNFQAYTPLLSFFLSRDQRPSKQSITIAFFALSIIYTFLTDVQIFKKNLL